MVTTFYPPHHFGGDSTYVRQLSQALVSLGHKVRVVYCYDAYRASGGTRPSAAADPSDGVERRMLQSRFGLLSPLVSQQTGRPGLKSSALAREFAEDWDVVHFHNISLVGGPAVTRLSRAPVTLITAHDHWLVCASHIFWKDGRKPCDGRTCFSCQLKSGRPPQLWRYGPLLKGALSKVDHVLVPSAFTERELGGQGIDRPTTVLPLFAPSFFDEMAQPEPPETPTFLYAGRVTASKGIGELAGLMAARPDYKLSIVGDGDLLDALQSRFARSSNIRFHGRLEQKDLKSLYRNVTATVLPSLAPETFGLTTVEGFSQSTPALVRDAGGAGEPVRASGAGIVFRTGEEALSAMDRLARDGRLRNRMGAAARRAYEDLYHQDVHLRGYLDVVSDTRESRR